VYKIKLICIHAAYINQWFNDDIYQVLVLSVLLYALETWAVLAAGIADMRTLEAFQQIKC